MDGQAGLQIDRLKKQFKANLYLMEKHMLILFNFSFQLSKSPGQVPGWATQAQFAGQNFKLKFSIKFGTKMDDDWIIS